MGTFESDLRVGVMGGSFNPVHCGHLRIASDVKRTLELDHMYLMPAAQSPLKVAHSVSVEHRVAMLKIALEDFPELELDCRELDREGRSYTIDSLMAIRSELGNSAGLYFVIGDDCLPSFHKWWRWRDITTVSNLIVTRRPGVFPDLPAEVNQWMTQTQVDLPTIRTMACGAVARMACALIDVSSTDLRKTLQAQRLDPEVIPVAVMEYINEHKLYS